MFRSQKLPEAAKGQTETAGVAMDTQKDSRPRTERTRYRKKVQRKWARKDAEFHPLHTERDMKDDLVFCFSLLWSHVPNAYLPELL